MDNFEKASAIARVMAVAAAEGAQYRRWDAKSVRDNINKAVGKLQEQVGKVDVTKLTEQEAVLLGFARWDDEGMRMVPLYLYPFLEHGQELTCISGKKIVVAEGYDIEPVSEEGRKVYIDNDHRGGFLAYGFFPK